jgi:hypothetical protein
VILAGAPAEQPVMRIQGRRKPVFFCLLTIDRKPVVPAFSAERPGALSGRLRLGIFLDL